MAKAAKILKDANIIDSRGENDTFKLWENYREQAMLWRGIAVLQVPITFFTLIMCMWLYGTRTTILNVPAKPLPGQYQAQEIPDTEFINTGTEFINLIASYQSNVARRQFLKAAEMLREPMLTKFRKEMMETELQAIETTNRTQIFFADPLKTKITRPSRDTAVLSVTGERLKIIAGRELPPVRSRFTVTMTTVPRNPLNPYGIVITDVKHENVLN
ncbi:MAG: hypothetical protein D6719_02635 [Candidatus Dadabacteria bacterium]|nr:MAG: hypothetical protein D6719_02635 [Candidatus Dadabacteria bacterium]